MIVIIDNKVHFVERWNYTDNKILTEFGEIIPNSDSSITNINQEYNNAVVDSKAYIDITQYGTVKYDINSIKSLNDVGVDPTNWKKTGVVFIFRSGLAYFYEQNIMTVKKSLDINPK